MQLSSLFAAFANTDVSLADRTNRITGELCKEVAFSLPLPSQPLVGLQKYFSEHCGQLMRTTVSKFNEQYPINVDETTKTIFELWKLRYDLLHNAWKVDVVKLLSALGDQADYTIAPALYEQLFMETPYEACSTVRQFVSNEIPRHESEAL